MFERFMFYIRHSLNDLNVNRRRTLFALLCIAAGVAAIVSLQTLAVMIEDTLAGSLQESNRGDLRLVPNRWFNRYTTEIGEDEISFEGGYIVTPEGLTLLRNWFEENFPGSEITYKQAVTGFNVATSASIPARDTDKFFIFNYFIEADQYPVYGRVETGDGESLSELLREPTDIVISANLASDLEAEVGDTLRLTGASQDFTVRGIVPADSEPGFQNIFAHLFGYFYLDISSVELFDEIEPGYASTVYVRLDDPSQVDAVARRLQRDFNAFDITTTSDLEEANEILSDSVDDLVVIMGLISLLIGGIGIVNTMLVIVSRRTTEVAVLKTIGLQPQEVTALFLVEALLMGVAGSFLGVLLGWLLAYLTKGVAENFLGQSLAFSVALRPALNGFVVGIVITAIFGFLPTLAAGQIRPALVLRPSETVLPRAGRLRAFGAIVGLTLALSLVAQSLLGNMLDAESLGGIPFTTITAIIGAVYGLAIAVPLVLGGIMSMRERRRGRSWLLHLLYWLVLLVVLPVLGALFGYNVPAVFILTVTLLLVSYLYVTLWLVIWAVAGGRVREIWPGILILAFPLFWPLIPLLIVLLIPLWILGWLIQRYTFVDFKIAMRALLAAKGRGATTLLALVVGVFTLSIITMLVDSITNVFEELLESATGGNIMIVTTGGRESLENIRTTLAEEGDAVRSLSIVGSFSVQMQGYWDASTGRSRSAGFGVSIGSVDGRELANLPGGSFVDGRNLNPARDSQPDAEGVWSAVVRDGWLVDSMGIEVGDILTFRASDGGREIRLRLVGIQSETGVMISNSGVYAPLEAFEGIQPDSVFAVADVKESEIKTVRRSLATIPGSFVLETRFLNDLINRIVDQFTSFPILVAALALVTGGVVIANTVALATLERRREIGVMKAIGLQRERVLGMLLLENSLLGLVGGLIGVGISFVGLALALALMFENELNSAIPYATAFWLMALCIGISLVAAILSVWGASGEKPLNILRYE